MEKLLTSSPVLDKFLSERGKRMHFPTDGIVVQAGESYGKRINATAGVAYDDDGNLMTLDSLQKSFGIETNTLNYAPPLGVKELRIKWLEEIHKKNPSLGNAPTTLPIVTIGLTHGINAAGQLFLAPGDEAILADMYWDNYELMFEMGLNAKLKTFPTFDGNGYNVKDIEKLALEEPIGKKFFVFNVPNNPTGYSPTLEEQTKIVEIIKRSAEAGNTIVALCDDAYFGLNYTNEIAPESIFAKLANAHENILAVKADGATKEEFAWGLRVGFLTFGGKGLTEEDKAILENKVTGIIRANTSNGCRPSQEALLKALNDPQHKQEKQRAFEILKERFEIAHTVLEENKKRFEKYFTLLPNNSGYFFCLKQAKGVDGGKVRQTLLKHHDIGIVSVKNYFRIAFSAVGKDKIPHLLNTLYEVCSEQE